METTYRVYLFNHDNESFPYKAIEVFKNQKEALLSACKIIALLADDHRQELYSFMEQKTMTFEIEFDGVHIYNGNISWSVFVTNCKLEKPIIGPITKDKDIISFGNGENN